MSGLWNVVAAVLVAAPVAAQGTNDPFPRPIEASDGVIVVDFVEFARLPDADGAPARMMLLVDEPGTGRMFVNDMRGPLYIVSYSGRTVREYLDVNDPRWGVGVRSTGGERGFPGAVTYDGEAPRELLRQQQPFGNHNGGQLAFNPTASPGDPDFGMLYVGSADGGSGGDPLNLSQDLSSAFGKILRIDPLGSNSANGQYGIPADNPFANDGSDDTLGEIYAYGARNPQRFAWDPETGNMFMADIGQNIVEELTLVEAGDNLGWNVWEGSFRFVSRSEVRLENRRGDPAFRYPVAEYGQLDPLLQRQSAATGVHVYRSEAIPQRFGSGPDGQVLLLNKRDGVIRLLVPGT